MKKDQRFYDKLALDLEACKFLREELIVIKKISIQTVCVTLRLFNRILRPFLNAIYLLDLPSKVSSI